MPNLLTALRIVLIIPFAIYLWQDNYYWAFYLAAIAIASDILDGFIARKFKMQSRLGAFLDPIADKLTTLIAFYLLSLKGLLPFWIFAITLARDATLLGGFFILYQKRIQTLPLPVLSGKISTLFQFLLIFSVIIPPQLFSHFRTMTPLLIWLTAATILFSFINYLMISIKLAKRHNY